MPTAVLDKYIVVDPAVCHGQPHIAGRRIRVQDVAVWHERLGLSADEISTDYDLSLAEVYAALAYYFAHKDQIDADISADASAATAAQAANPSPLRSRLAASRGR